MPSLEWIKITCDLPDKWQTQTMRRILKLRTTDEVVGKLFRVWRHFENQSKNGFIPRLDADDLDSMIGKNGFAKAMAEVGWLQIDTDGLRLPNFSEYMGGASRERDAAAERQRRARNGGVTEPAQPAEHDRNKSVIQPVTAPEQERDTTVTESQTDRDQIVTVTPPKKEKEKEKEIEEKTPPLPPVPGGDAGGQDEPKPPRPKTDSRPKPKPRPTSKPDPESEPRFREFWAAYPRKVQETKAAGIYAVIDPSPELQAEILAAIADQKTWPKWAKDDGEYIPYPANWLENRQWRDKPPEVLAPGPDDVASNVDPYAELKQMAASMGYAVESPGVSQ